MQSVVVVLLSLLSITWTKDITLGNVQGRKVFDEIRLANPAIWRQYENVTVIAPDNELISSVVITDMRPEKDGDVQIVSGGDGQKSVTIELKSPTVLRGYEFHIEVYSVPDTVATDAEENLHNEDISPVQNNESTELPDIANTDNHDDVPIQSNDSTVLADSANSKDIKDFSALISSEADSNRPGHGTDETDENNSQTDVPEDIVTGSESEDDVYITTELPATPIEDTIPEDTADYIRPARETELHTSAMSTVLPDTVSTEGEMTTLEAVSEIGDATSTEPVVTTISHDQATFAPVVNDNSKNIPDYASLNILDYIKNKESVRPSRHTEDQNSEEIAQTTSSPVQTDGTTPSLDENSSIKPDDDTIDLVPPKTDASYNKDFHDSETTVNPIGVTALMNALRGGRGIQFDDNKESTSTTFSTDEKYSTTPANVDITTATLEDDQTVAAADDQFRNTRGTSNDQENESNINISGPEQNVPSDPVTPSGGNDIKQTNNNVIVINLDEYMPRDENNRFIYSLPIVLIINGDSKFPIIRIIAEDAINDSDKELFPTLPSDESLNPNDFDFKMTGNDRIKGDYMPSGDYDQNK